MRDVGIVGIGQTPVGEHWQASLRHLAHDAVVAAIKDSGLEQVDALYIGNMLSGELNGQALLHLGSLDLTCFILYFRNPKGTFLCAAVEKTVAQCQGGGEIL